MKEGPLKAAFFRALAWSGAQALSEALARGVPVLAYHGVTQGADPAGNLRRLHVPRHRFEEHLRLLSARHQPIALGELVGRLAAGRALPRRAVVLTFDDGYVNFKTQAWPLLQAHGVPATLFVVTDGGGSRLWYDEVETAVLRSPAGALEWEGRRFVLEGAAARLSAARSLVAALERMDGEALRTRQVEVLQQRLGAPPPAPDEDRDRLGWDDLRALARAGLDVGAHADRHEPLTARPRPELAAALAASRGALERELGPGPRTLSYPFGAHDPEIAAAARAAGFAGAVTCRPALARSGDDAFALPRFLLGADDDRPRLRAALSGLRGAWQRDPGAAR